MVQRQIAHSTQEKHFKPLNVGTSGHMRFTALGVVVLCHKSHTALHANISYINVPTVCVCLSVPCEISGTEHRIAALLCHCKEILLASCTTCFSNLCDAWFERESLWNFSAGYALKAVHARYTSHYMLHFRLPWLR